MFGIESLLIYHISDLCSSIATLITNGLLTQSTIILENYFSCHSNGDQSALTFLILIVLLAF